MKCTNEALRAQVERDLRVTLAALDYPVRGSYSPGEVQMILGISASEFHRLIRRHEVNHSIGILRHPCSLDSFMLRRQRRVRYAELADFLYRNSNEQRICG